MTPLEEAASAVAAEMGISPHAEMTGEQVAEFRERFTEAMAKGAYEYVILPSAPSLTKDEVRQLLRECVTVVKPGETLVVRVGGEWTPAQMREMQDALNWGWDDGTPYWPFRTLIVYGEELGVAEVPGA